MLQYYHIGLGPSDDSLHPEKSARAETYNPTPLTSFLENYTPYHGQNRVLRAYETRTLKPFICTASRSQSILIQHDGNLSRRRITPVPDPSPFFSEKIAQKFFGVQNFRRSLEALDLRVDSKHPVARIKFEGNSGTQRTINSTIFHGKRRQRRQRLFICVKILSPIILFVLLVGVGLSYLTSSFSINLSSMDRHLCGVVHPRIQPCKISPNPDVAGIGGRIALYMQVFLLAILLTFSSEGALSASWALVFTSTTFALSALIATATSQLTLYHVILTAKLQGLPIAILTIVTIFPPQQRGPYIFLLNLFRLTVSITVLAWYSVVAPCFGSQPECNAYVVSHGWFFSEQAIASAPRVSSLGLVAFTFTVTYLRLLFFWKNSTLAFQSLFSDEARRKWYGLPVDSIYKKEIPTKWKDLKNWAIAGILDDNSTPSVVRLNMRLTPKISWASPSLPHPVTAMTRITHSSPPLPNRPWILYQTASLNVRNALRYPKVWRLLIALGIGGILVHSIEATISSNVVDVGENAWTYGQVMVVIMTAVPVVQTMQLVGLLPSERNPTKSGYKKKVL